jgi:alanine dehydrogenase
MKIGIAKENRPLEKRVIISPPELAKIAAKHEVLVEKDAGVGLGITNAEYEKVGAKIASTKEVYSCDLVVRIKEPNEKEVAMMKEGVILLSMMHIRCNIELENNLKKKKAIAIPMENIKDPFGKRMMEAVEDSGRIGMEYGFKLWGKNPETATVTIMGYGNISVGAIRAASRKRANVTILNRKHFTEMEKHLSGTDILVDAVNRPFRREVTKEPPFVTREMLKLLKKGSVCVDLVSNPEGHAPIETMRPTFLNDPYYEVDGIYHTSLWGWPVMEPETIAKRYSVQIAPFILDIADNGIDNVSDPVKNAVIKFNA